MLGSYDAEKGTARSPDVTDPREEVSFCFRVAPPARRRSGSGRPPVQLAVDMEETRGDGGRERDEKCG